MTSEEKYVLEIDIFEISPSGKISRTVADKLVIIIIHFFFLEFYYKISSGKKIMDILRANAWFGVKSSR